MSELNPFLLAANVPDPDPRLLPLLRSKPELAAQQDNHGYSLLHAAASYNHVDLLRSLHGEFHVDINLKDEDGETCLYVAETVEVAKCLVEDLSIDVNTVNDEGMTALQKIETEGDYPEIAAYLQQTSAVAHATNRSMTTDTGISHPPPLPPHMRMNITTVSESASEIPAGEPDPEFRRRIEELAARENFNSEEGQRELRDLITDAMRGVGNEDREVRRRTD